MTEAYLCAMFAFAVAGVILLVFWLLDSRDNAQLLQAGLVSLCLSPFLPVAIPLAVLWVVSTGASITYDDRG